jgi:enoyl-CoA hydratase/carnithine racemase
VTYEHIETTCDPPVGRLVLNRPERRNALSLAAIGEVTRALEELAGTPGVRAIVIEGRGPAFSAGHDIGEMRDREPAFYQELFGQCTEMMQTVHRVPQPVIAKVGGIATAAGCQLVASCDLVVAAEGSMFATPGVRIGLFCSTPMVPISRAVGQKRAMEMLLTGEPISVDTAYEWGLVNRVAPREELDDAVGELVGQITRWSPTVVGIGKDAFYRQAGLTEDSAYEVAEPTMIAGAGAPEAQEGFAAFLEKRPAVWSTKPKE